MHFVGLACGGFRIEKIEGRIYLGHLQGVVEIEKCLSGSPYNVTDEPVPYPMGLAKIRPQVHYPNVFHSAG